MIKIEMIEVPPPPPEKTFRVTYTAEEWSLLKRFAGRIGGGENVSLQVCSNDNFTPTERNKIREILRTIYNSPIM